MSNSMYVPPELLKEILLRLPLKSLGNFKTVSKGWRSIIESKNFIDMHLSFQKSDKRPRRILAGYKSDTPRLSGPELGSDIEIMYLHCDTSRPSMSCDGLICMPEPGWINVLNPSTGELRSFPSGPDPEPSALVPRYSWQTDNCYSYFPGNWAMGFGRDNVAGTYKVVRMCFDPVECGVLDVGTGGWRKLNPPTYEVDVGRRSACVNGSIYWLDSGLFNKILALDLHTEEFHDVNSLPLPQALVRSTQILNLDDRLAISKTLMRVNELEIWCMDPKEERWTKTFLINLADVTKTYPWYKFWWFTPLMVSKEGNILICDGDNKSLFKYYPHNNTIRQLSPFTCCFISPYLENLVRLKI